MLASGASNLTFLCWHKVLINLLAFEPYRRPFISDVWCAPVAASQVAMSPVVSRLAVIRNFSMILVERELGEDLDLITFSFLVLGSLAQKLRSKL
jgi:hypothetical protein